MDLHEARLAHHPQRGGEVLLRLAGEADDDVRAQGGPVQGRPDAPTPFEEAAAAVAPLHGGEDAVGAALQAQVQVRAEAALLRQDGDQLVAGLGGLHAAQADPEVPRQAAQAAQQARQPHPFRLRPAPAPVQAVVTQVDAGQHHLGVTRIDQPADLVGDLPRRAAADDGTNAWDDAIRTVQQAAVLHLDEGPLVAVKAADAG